MTDEEFQAIEARCYTANLGVWYYRESGIEAPDDPPNDDAAADIMALLAEVRRLRQENERAQTGMLELIGARGELAYWRDMFKSLGDCSGRTRVEEEGEE